MDVRGAFTFAEDVDGTPGSSGRPGWGSGGGSCAAPAAFAVWQDDKENVDPRFAPAPRLHRADEARPLTPGAVAAAAREAATAAPQTGAAAEDPKSRDGGGGAQSPRRAALSDITQYVPPAADDGKKLRTRAFMPALGGAGENCATGAGYAAPLGMHQPLRPVSTSLRHSMR